MRIGNVYRPDVFGCWVDERLPDVARRMAEKDVGALAVLDGNEVVGVITERDLVRALAESPDVYSARVSEFATTDVETADVEDDSREVAERMLEAGFRHMPVTQNGEMVGMVSMRDLLALETWSG
ncbi:histidine kinase [Thermobispora bispora]|jgi:CBS domain-containing protein|uniref:Putative signal transduction protein with CBS domains n=1 Tax=Thermobispora bispora (strain ATCC 19993 / DSM 43833 / CBS 139.67 / JCM 10125 / KCTC 9307 / NBRC 14880 / R51) TaxID=469371 RepID=D6Y484_THEBD|nr:CBS domain-containing protein [Thermobispora bispora]MBO2475897.1 CBS domain-containing protein [Actinomycetales bacterium]MDI9581933.1 CBS domain-containing protein [Thermobispora sp.]ADG87138.1 putative signal transduction protein with CBS domains [Thermobispora bispora DSM 43833]MBX6168597.1 CBS domain-containing protein [Thermobispora bispora]QSI47106.1 CBS domain-containing protein [Thermobispora bispora]